MKKMIVTIVFLLMYGMVFAQYAAPENLKAHFEDTFASPGFAQNVCFYWDRIDDPNMDYYETFCDGEPYEIVNWNHIYIETPQDNDYHTASVRAVYVDGGMSDIVTLTYYYSFTAYANVRNITVENSSYEMYANIEFDEPLSGGDNAPTPQSYILYINNEVVDSSSIPEINVSLDGLVNMDEGYVLGVEVQYSDGHSSTTFHSMPHYESYLGDLNRPGNVSVDEMTGMLSWQVPGCNDVIGGTISNLVGSMMGWTDVVWPIDSPFQFGDETKRVNLAWAAQAWVENNGPGPDVHLIQFGRTGFQPHDTQYFSSEDLATSIKQINAASTLDFAYTNFSLHDSPTSPDGYGDFVVLKNIETGYYGVVQLIEAPDTWQTVTNRYMNFDIAWWFQTNGSDDFSSAQQYYPLYYNIYLDGAFVDSVNYELVTMENNTAELIIIDSTLSPTINFEYQLEGLVNGQTYYAMIEAVYQGLVGKSDPQMIEFTYNGISVDDPQTGTMIPEITNYPNPFKDHTNISFSIAKPGHVTLDIYNVKGEKVKTLVDETIKATDYSIEWNGTDDHGKSVSNGVYFYKMSVDNENIISNKMMLMR